MRTGKSRAAPEARQRSALPEQAQARQNDLLVRKGHILTERTIDKNKLAAVSVRGRMHEQAHGPNALQVRRAGVHRDDFEAMPYHRSAIEPTIEQMKMHERLGRSRSRARWAMRCMR
ncbi:hypothetical protein ACSFA0_04140 [Variovorax sp. LT1P1]|uniref:hypothetical protein n=1 Tax=Variovorax sp. LT1P1 TaxID=3443730 RepID=UPI003F47CF37